MEATCKYRKTCQATHCQCGLHLMVTGECEGGDACALLDVKALSTFDPNCPSARQLVENSFVRHFPVPAPTAVAEFEGDLIRHLASCDRCRAYSLSGGRS